MPKTLLSGYFRTEEHALSVLKLKSKKFISIDNPVINIPITGLGSGNVRQRPQLFIEANKPRARAPPFNIINAE